MTPLAKRIPRDFIHNLGKYLGIFVLLVMAIMFTSGFLTSAASIADIANGMRDKYTIEDFYFVTMYEATDESLDAVEELGATVYENFSRDVSLSLENEANKDMTVRVYKNRDGSFNAAVYAQGRAPEAAHEIALDRVFCANHSLSLGDKVTVAGEEFELVGIVTLSDYQVTYKNAGDFMFNATTFTVAQLTDEDWERVVGDGVTFRYSVVMDDRNLELHDRLDFEEDAIDAINDHDSTVTDLVDCDANIGLTFASDDVEGDSMMWTVLMVILIVIMAFVFVVLTDATIEQESAVIGTLLASGYRKGELIRHYLALPTIIGFIGCALGVVLGYTVMAAPMQGLYYNSYSFPPYVAGWHTDVFLLTTVLPFVLLVGITLLGLIRKLGATPLQFLRGEASKKARRGGMRLSERLSFPLRFRLRVFLRNFSHFVTLYFGILFGSLLLLMGLAMLPIVSINADLMSDSVPANHVYTLKAPLVIDATQAQRDAWAAAFELKTNPDYDNFDLDLLSDLIDQLEDAGVDVKKLEEQGLFDDGADKTTNATATTASKTTAESALPQQMQNMIEDSVKNRSWKADDPVIHAMWRQVAQAAGITLDCTEDELTKIIHTADAFHVKFHKMSDDAMKKANDLLGDLMKAASDPSVDLNNMEDPVNQTAFSDATLAQVEKFAVTTIEVPRRLGDSNETVTVYGIAPDSQYWTYANVSDHRVLCGTGLTEKCEVDLGTAFTARDKAKNEDYELVVDETCNNACDLNIYMSIDDFNEFFGEEADHFNGYASDEALKLDERYVASDLTPDKMRSMADQMQDSMGQVMRLMVMLVIPLYFVLMYLLTKTVIDRSARAISYMKVFGYHLREIVRLYVRTITVTVAFSLVTTVPILIAIFRLAMKFMMADYSGNFVIEVPPSILATEIAIGFATYVVVALFHVAAVRRVSLALALKVQE